MINYSYTFSRDEKDTIVTLHPSYKSPFFNVSNLKGSSSTGKSTLMNLIALAFWGYDDQKIQQSLRNRVKYIYENPKIQLDFDIEMIANNGMIIKSHVIKKNNDDGTKSIMEIKARICEPGGTERPIFKEEFRQKFSLIYDIPDNPTKRIDESLKEIQNAQKKYLNRVQNLKKIASNTQDDIRNSRDPKKIELYKGKIEEQKSLKHKDEEILSMTNTLLDSLRKYYWASVLNDNYQKLIDLDERIKGLKKQARSANKANKELITKYNVAVSNHNNKIVKLIDSYCRSKEALEKLRQYKEIDDIHLDVWSRYNINHNTVTKDIDVKDDFIQTAINLEEILKKLCEKYDSQQDNQKYEILKSFMNILRNSDESLGIKILDKSTSALYNAFELELAGIEQRVSRYHDYDAALKSVASTLEKANSVHQSFLTLPEKPLDEETPETNEDLMEQKQHLQDHIGNLLKSASKCDVYADNVVNVIEQSENNPLLLPYISLDIPSLNNVIIQLSEETKNLNEKITGLNGYNAKISYLEKVLSDLQACKDHPLSHHAKRVELLVKKLNDIQSDLGMKIDILEKIIDRQNNLVCTKKDQDQVKYLEQVWNNLGKRFGHIRHMGQEYEIVKVDLMESTMKTRTGKEFSINDMGTGESQSAYLMNVLRSNQNTCIIAMFDESENMDYELRHGILKRFKELYDEDHLILGLTASHHSGSNNESVVEEFYGDE